MIRVRRRRVPRTEDITLHSSSEEKYCHTSASPSRSLPHLPAVIGLEYRVGMFVQPP